MALPQILPIPQEQAIASYDYFDIAEGTGIKKFYGLSTSLSTGTTYSLNANPLFSSEIGDSDSPASTNWTNVQDKDFDLAPFNLPKIINGTAYISIYLNAYREGAGWLQAYITAKIRKWDGSSETEIASAQSETLDSSAGGAGARKVLTIPVTVPKTHFKKGETLRLTIVTAARYSGAGVSRAVIGYDPQNRDFIGNVIADDITPSTDATQTTKVEFFCPFDLDL